MRAKLGLLIVALTVLLAGGASARHLAKAADVIPAATASEIALADAVFATPQRAAAAAPAAAPADPSGVWSLESAPGDPQGKASRVLIRQHGGVIDTTRFSFDGSSLVPAIGHAVPLANPSIEPRQVVDVSYTRAWPSVVKIPAGPYALDITPHAGVGFGDYGNSAEAGATIGFRPGRALDRLSSKHGEWYVFASASGRSVGLNMIDPTGGPSTLPTAWYAEGATARVNSVQAGVGWRHGRVDAMLGYVGWQVKTEVDNGAASAAPRYRDSLLGFSINLRL
jgi:hypothetical protein